MFSHSWFVKHSRPALSMMFQAELPPFLGKPNGSQRHTDWPENWEYLRQLPAAWVEKKDGGEFSKVEWYPQKNREALSGYMGFKVISKFVPDP